MVTVFLEGMVHGIKVIYFVIRAWSICPRCTAAYRLIVRPLSPRDFLDVPTSAARCLHVHTTQEILAAKGGTMGENVGQ